MFKLRDYQQEASDRAVKFFNDKGIKHNSIIVLPTGSGKSLVIADIADKLDGDVLVFQPSKEILEQNFAKLTSYGTWDCSIFSASCNSKQINRITFATIGSVKNNVEAFSHFKYVIVDECHLCNPKEGMYKDFFATIQCKILGLTATPYRLYSNGFGSELRFLTRTKSKIFKELIYNVQISVLSKRGYLSKLEYYSFNGIDRSRLRHNSTGADYTDKSIQEEYKLMGFSHNLLSMTQRLLWNAKVPRKGVLVFTRFINEAQELIDALPDGVGVVITGTTRKSDRERILTDFKSGAIKVVANVGVLTTGFDYPELDTIILARPTMSLALYYQMVGRAIRPHQDKQAGYIIDLCGNIDRFGKVEELTLCCQTANKYFIRNRNKQLTNIILS